MSDGFVVLYCKDGLLYPVALTESQHSLLQGVIGIALDHKVVCDFNNPQGRAINTAEQLLKTR